MGLFMSTCFATYGDKQLLLRVEYADLFLFLGFNVRDR